LQGIVQSLQYDIEGKKAEVANTKEQCAELVRVVERYRAKYGEGIEQMDR
jgi:hypothetical protein